MLRHTLQRSLIDLKDRATVSLHLQITGYPLTSNMMIPLKRLHDTKPM